jgi:hypothetical protein
MKIRYVAPLFMLAAVAGCGDSEKIDAGTQSAARAPAAAAAGAVAAVLQSSGAPLAKLGFVVLAVPVNGTQSGLRLELSASEPVPTLQLSVEGDGVTVDAATSRMSFALATAGATAHHEVRFVPQREGLAQVTVRLRQTADGPETVYAIPVLVAKATGA